MIHKNNSQIQWGTNVRFYMFGSQIEHHPDGSVNFSNPLIASGTEIHSWLAIQNYQASRKQPSLPLLKKGYIYRLESQFTTVPEGTVYLKLSFLNRYGEEVKQMIEKKQSFTFVYPHEAYNYSISLLSAGMVELDFKGMTITEVGEENV